VRLALGAKPADILWLFFRQAAILVGIGIAIAIPVVLAGSRAIASQLYGIEASDKGTIASAAAVLAVVALSAALVAAKRAAVIQPIAALRHE
jgi:ABC-type antimicrobial peptide transport system permease subunit